MRKSFVLCVIVLGTIWLSWVVSGQDATTTPGPAIVTEPASTPGSDATTFPAAGVTPAIAPEPSALPQTSPILPDTTPALPTGAITPPANIPPPITPPPITPPPSASGESEELSAVRTSSSFEWSEKGAPVFELEKAVITALQQNPDILRAKEEIERTRGVVLELTALVLPHVSPRGDLMWTDPHLAGAGSGTLPGGTDTAYEIRITGTQLVFNYGTFRAIRGTFFQRDSAYFAFRNTVDQVISTTKTQFYQVILDRALIGVQEESVRLLESQLKDQQNRFEAGTVPRFNVLQAQVQLFNQIPNLIAARNNYRISILTLAKTLGIDFNPARGIASPLHVVGELGYIPRNVELLSAIEQGKQNRPFLKQARANVFNQVEQVHVAIGNFFPNFMNFGGYEILSSPLTTDFDAAAKGWVFQLEGNWAIWDSGETYGRVKQQRALLSQAVITYDDDVRQVELEVQQAASNLLQNRELIQATEKNVEQADEAVRLAKARLDAGAGTQLDVLNAQVQLTTAQSTRLQALFGYDSSLAEFDRVTGAQGRYTEQFDAGAPRATRSKRYYTGSDVDAYGKPKRPNGFQPGPVTPMSGSGQSK